MIHHHMFHKTTGCPWWIGDWAKRRHEQQDGERKSSRRRRRNPFGKVYHKWNEQIIANSEKNPNLMGVWCIGYRVQSTHAFVHHFAMHKCHFPSRVLQVQHFEVQFIHLVKENFVKLRKIISNCYGSSLIIHYLVFLFDLFKFWKSSLFFLLWPCVCVCVCWTMCLYLF